MGPQAAFQMQLATFKGGVRYVGLPFRRLSRADLSIYDPVVFPVMGESMDYGALFSYLFRRFGYPNLSWDSYKDLVRYILKTPHPDMLLEVVPHVTGSTSLMFFFHVPEDVHAAIEAYDNKDFLAWESRAFSWQERHGLPDWMPLWLKCLNESVLPAWGVADPAVTDWRASLQYAMTLGEPGNSHFEISQLAEIFRISLYENYESVEPKPPCVPRGEDWSEWDDSDPLKPFAKAAQTALKSLHTPVRVRDSSINAFGAKEYTRRPLKEAPVSGYPSGALGNTAPREFAELHGLVLELGDGDAKKGIANLMALANGGRSCDPHSL